MKEGLNMFERRKTSNVFIGDIGIGSDYPVTIQSMTNTDTRNVEKTLSQIKELTQAGCEIIRIAIPDMEAAEKTKDIVSSSPIPVIADIHFDYRLALETIKNGIHGLRINPGNIGNEERIRQVVESAKAYNIPIRIGVNSGSVEKEMLEKYKGVNSNSLIESALKHVKILEKMNFDQIKISIKASEVPLMIDVYRKLAKKVDYPLHLGVTEAGSVNTGIIKSAVGVGTLLAEGIGDTIRVSLTGNPVNEIIVAKDILKSLKLKEEGIQIVSCPTCGRCQVDLEKIVLEVEEKTKGYKENIKLAIMGCVVNGPGEAREADIGIAGGINEGLLFKKGEIIRKIKEEDIVKELLIELEKIRGEKNESI